MSEGNALTTLPTLGAYLADQFLGTADETEELEPLVPSGDTPPAELGSRFVEYGDRGPRDVILSGPVRGGAGPGRYHPSRRAAWEYAVAKYGVNRVRRLEQDCFKRWALIVKNLRQETP